MGSLRGPFSDPKVGSSGGTARTGGGIACELENSKNLVSEAIRWWYHPDTIFQALVPPDWAMVWPSVRLQVVVSPSVGGGTARTPKSQGFEF